MHEDTTDATSHSEQPAQARDAATATASLATTICALCRAPAVLQKSHIIADAYFRAMKDKNGKLVRFDTYRDTAVMTGQDSWKEYMLCQPCEAQFSRLENRWIAAFDQADREFANGLRTVELQSFDYDSLNTYLLSILWRAAVASHERFAQVMLTRPDQEVLRSLLLAGSTAALEDWSIHIRKIVDRRGILCFDHMMRAPKCISIPGAVVGFSFIFGGYMVDFVLHKETVGRTRLRPGPSFTLQSSDMTEVEEIMALGRVAIDKTNRGLDKRSNKVRA